MKREYTYTIKMEAAEEGGYVVSVPALPGCFTQGENYEAALSNAKEAILCYIEAMQKLGRTIPVEKQHSPRMNLLVKIPQMA